MYAQVLINPEGEIQAVHRKSNLKSGEKTANYKAGSVPVTITDIKGVRTGIVICSDAASPSTMREMMRSHPDLILLSLADDSDEKSWVKKVIRNILVKLPLPVYILKNWRKPELSSLVIPVIRITMILPTTHMNLKQKRLIKCALK